MTPPHLTGTLLVTVAMILNSCATNNAPVRAHYVGPDYISSADARCLIGRWLTQELNPIENQPPQETLIEYRSDGTVTGTVSLALADETQAPGADAFHVLITGTWSLQKDLITHSDIKMESLNDDAVSMLLSEVINNSSHELGGAANIYELSASQMITVGADGVAIQYFRQKDENENEDTRGQACRSSH